MNKGTVLKIPNHGFYTSSLILWGLLHILSKVYPAITEQDIVIEGYDESYAIQGKIDIERLNEKLREQIENLRRELSKPFRDLVLESRSIRAWLGPFSKQALKFLRSQLSQYVDELDLMKYTDVHTCREVKRRGKSRFKLYKKPHVPIIGILGKWYYGFLNLNQLTDEDYPMCDLCRSLAILGLERMSIVYIVYHDRKSVISTILTLGFQGVLREEDIFYLYSLLNPNTPWRTELERALSSAKITNTILPLIISAYLPVDLPLQNCIWYLIANQASMGRTISFGIYPLSKYVTFTKIVSSLYPWFSALIDWCLYLLSLEEPVTECLEILEALSELVETRNSEISYRVLRTLTQVLQRVHMRPRLGPLNLFVNALIKYSTTLI